MLEKKLISVIIPTWNRREPLARALRSALAQEGVSVEVLVCDDGSDDGTREMIAGWADSRVQLLTGPRAGRPAIPRNRGIAAAKGEWLAFLDDDDEWMPHKLRSQLGAGAKNGALAVCANALRHVPGGVDDAPYFSALPDTLHFADLVRVNSVISSSALIHGSLFKQVVGFPESPALTAVEDYALWLRIAALTPFACVSEPLLIYYDDPAQSIRGRCELAENKRMAAVFANWLQWAGGRAFSHQGLLVLKKLAELFFSPVCHRVRRLLLRLKP